jgi:hypothetical protein
VSARLFALRRDNGEQLWQRDFTHLLLDPAQPGTWPFFLLTADGEPDEASENRTLPHLAIILDRATGKTLHAAEFSTTASPQRGWMVDAATGAVSIKIGGVGILVASGPGLPPATKTSDEKHGPGGNTEPNPKSAPTNDPPPPPRAIPGT